MKKLIHLVVGLLLTTSATISSAAQIGISDFSGSESVIAMAKAGTPPVGPFTYQGATFSESSSGTGGPGWRNLTNSGFGFTDNAGISNISILLNSSYSKVGLDLYVGPATYQVSFFDSGLNVVGTLVETVADNGPLFAGFYSAIGISGINILETSGDNGMVGGFDNIRFGNSGGTVPEPASIALLGLGLLGIVATRRKSAK